MTQIDRSKAVHFTGHRKIAGTYEGPAQDKLMEFLSKLVQEWSAVGWTTWISGGAIGVDQIAMDAVRWAMTFGAPAKLVIARPFPSQASKWPHASQARFAELCKFGEVIDVSPDPYTPQKMQIRNIWMVDNACVTIAVWDGKESGGTWNCIQSAKQKGNKILHIHPTTLENKWL
jgi:uncharacterized phage-like protein YoqJ